MRRKRKKRRAPVQVDVPVEDVDCDVAQGENHSGTENNLAMKDISVFVSRLLSAEAVTAALEPTAQQRAHM